MAKAIGQKPLKISVAATGLMHIHGRDGVGKTLFALTAVSDPSKICLLDGDSGKSEDLAKEVGLGKYYDLTKDGKGLTEVDYHKMVLKAVGDIPKDKYDVLVLDNAAEFFKGGHSLVATNHPTYRKVWRGDAPIIGGIEWQETRLTHFPRFYSLLQEKASLVIIITHEKEQSVGGVKTGLTVPIGDPSLRTAAGIIIRLIKNTREHSPAPVGLVIKNTGTIRDGKPIKYFPDRISPCDWDKIRGYIDEPISNREPTDEETPNGFEQHLIMGTLNPEQQKMLEWRKSMMVLQTDENLAGAVLEVAAQNKDMNPVYLVREIVNVLKSEYPELTNKQVQKILDKSLED